MTREEYHRILFDLGILDDEEDWELYLEQEARYNDYEYKSEVEDVGYPLYNYSLKIEIK